MRLLDELGQQLNLHRVLVADAEIFDLAAVLQDGEGFGDFFRFHQRIRPMQQEHVQIIGSQAFQAAIDRFQNMFFGKVERAFANAAFGLEDHLFRAAAGVMLQASANFASDCPPP